MSFYFDSYLNLPLLEVKVSPNKPRVSGIPALLGMLFLHFKVNAKTMKLKTWLKADFKIDLFVALGLEVPQFIIDELDNAEENLKRKADEKLVWADVASDDESYLNWGFVDDQIPEKFISSDARTVEPFADETVSDENPTFKVEASVDYKLTSGNSSHLTEELDWKAQTMVAVTPIHVERSVSESPVIGSDTGAIQSAIDELLPHHHLMDDRYFQSAIETDDVSLILDDAKIDLSKFPKRLEPREVWNPRIQSGICSQRVNSLRESAFAIKKRNQNVPNLTQLQDVKKITSDVVDKFMDSIIDKSKLVGFPDDDHDVGCFLDDYLSRKGLSWEHLEPAHCQSIDKYKHMIKSTLKPVEEDTLHLERPIAATITYHTKEKVSVTTPFFLAMAAKLQTVLSDKVFIPMGENRQLHHLDATIFDKVKHWKEIDYSKFDKSQGLLHHNIQKEIFLNLKMNPEFVMTWFDSHMRSKIFDSESGIGFATDFQRRTGDACTYLGNTLVTLATLCYIYDLSDPNVLMIVVSGDDSLIGSLEPLPRDRENLCAELFNFDTKFPHNQPFICSKFLITVECADGGRRVLAMPNPLKVLMKLGVRCMNRHLFPAWAESIKDYVKDLFVSDRALRTLCDYVGYRCGRRSLHSLYPAMLQVKWLIANNKRMELLFFPPKEGNVPKNTKRVRSKTRGSGITQSHWAERIVRG